MWTTSALPFALTCAGYLALSLSGPARLAAPDAAGQMDRFFILSGWTLLPAACIVVLSLFRVDVKQAMFWSILAGGAVCLTVQGMEPGELFACLAFGYTPRPERKYSPEAASGPCFRWRASSCCRRPIRAFSTRPTS